MLDEVAAEAARLANAQTQPAGLDTEVDTMDVEPSKLAGHGVTRLAVAACEEGRKDARSGSTTAKTQRLKAKLRGVVLKRHSRLLDRNRITTLTCCSR